MIHGFLSQASCWDNHPSIRPMMCGIQGFKTLERSYLLRVNDKIVERPQHMCRGYKNRFKVGEMFGRKKLEMYKFCCCVTRHPLSGLQVQHMFHKMKVLDPWRCWMMSTYIGRDFPGISGSHPEQTVVCDLLPAHHRRRIQVQRLRKSKFTCEIRKIIESVFQSNDILASTDFQYWKYNWIFKQNSESPRIMRAACGIHCGDLAATLESLLIRKTDPLISNPSQEPPGTQAGDLGAQVMIWCHGNFSHTPHLPYSMLVHQNRRCLPASFWRWRTTWDVGMFLGEVIDMFSKTLTCDVDRKIASKASMRPWKQCATWM